jgi:UDP-2,3-diacylglucosamine pyrophosphatase LpxH
MAANGNRKIQWLHISDVHINSGDPYDRNTVFDALIKSLPTLKQKGLDADLIFFTGDIAYAGKPKEYDAAGKLFDEILKAFELSRGNLFVVPGNHDVDRTAGFGLARSLQSEEDSQRYFGGEGPLLHAMRQKNFKDWYDQYFVGIRSFDNTTSCGPYAEIDIDGFRVGVLPLNTAIFSADDDDHGKLWLGRRALQQATRTGTESAHLVIGIMHHPLDWLSEVERGQITTHLREFCDCLLRGHLHQNEEERIESRSTTTLHLAAGALYQNSQWPNCAQFVEVSDAGFSIRPIRYSDTPSPQWIIDNTIYPEQPDYFGFVPRDLSDRAPTNEIVDGSPPPFPVLEHPELKDERTGREATADVEFERDLFVSPNGTAIYVEPRLSQTAPEQVGLLDETVQFIGASDVVAATESFAIYCQSEYGGTTLSKRLYRDFKRNGASAELRDAANMPQYRAKLRDAFVDQRSNNEPNTLILDNYDHLKHERLLKEINSLEIFTRVILISTVRGAQMDSRPPSVNGTESKKLFLWAVSRQGIRTIAATLLDSADDRHISSVVEKVYSDLLALSIPLTPFNAVMYIKVLSKEYDFQPFNRVDIVEKYMGGALSTSSEAFAGQLTSKDKLEILTEFAYSLYSRSASFFTDIEWFEFSKQYTEETLTSFSASDLLRSLEESKILFRFTDRLYFKYSFYFSFLVGRYISSRPEVASAFLSTQSVYAVYGVVETIAGLTADGTKLIEHLTTDLESKLDQFFERFIPRDFDPLAHAEWELSRDDESVWEKVNQAVEEGPVSTSELDLIRTSFRREAQTADQQVRYSELKTLEYEVFVSSLMLTQALKASHGVRAGVKKRALIACLTTDVIGMQLGTILASEIAKRDWVQWGGAIFLGFKSEERDSKDELAATVAIVSNIPNAVAVKAADDLASRKLGEAFKAIVPDLDPGSFINVLAFTCVLTSKPSGWPDILEKQISKVGRRAYYLAVMLNMLMRDFQHGVNKQADIDTLKRLIATIYAKRNYNKAAPGAKLVNDMIKTLESDGTLSKSPSDIVDGAT